jgi:hypothetical protein
MRRYQYDINGMSLSTTAGHIRRPSTETLSSSPCYLENDRRSLFETHNRQRQPFEYAAADVADVDADEFPRCEPSSVSPKVEVIRYRSPRMWLHRSSSGTPLLKPIRRIRNIGAPIAQPRDSTSATDATAARASSRPPSSVIPQRSRSSRYRAVSVKSTFSKGRTRSAGSHTWSMASGSSSARRRRDR